MMMCAALAPTLLGCSFSTQKRDVVLQHAIENYQHLMGYRHDRAFWPRRGDSSRNRVWNIHPLFRVAAHAHCTSVVRK
jgi:hypothetical protein